MSAPTDLAQAWLDALRSWLSAQDEGNLAAGYSLGRRALAEGLGPLSLSELHARALAACAQLDVGTSSEGRANAGWRFFTEALAPSELALRGYSNVIADLRQLTKTLEARVEERSAALLAAERKYQAMIEQLPVVTYSAPLDAQAPMQFVSPQVRAVTGFTPEEWRAGPDRWAGRIHPDDRERVEAEVSRSEHTGTLQLEYRLVRKDGAVAWVRDDATRVVDSEGARYQGIWLDVTERRHLEDQLRQAQKLDAVGRLAGGVAHDFNNLLTAILSFSRFVHQDLGPDHPSRPDVEEVLHAAERGAALTRQLLAFSRNQSFRPQRVALGDTLKGMERMLRRLLGERVELDVRVDGALRSIEADLSQVEQVILNLVVNAGDAMPSGGRVSIELLNATLDSKYVRGQLGAPPGDYVQLAISDTGVGMDAETQRRVFEPFFTTKAPGKGTGLGLATVYGVTRQLGGDLILYSTPGRGTTFKVFFPCAPDEGGVAPTPEVTGEVRGDETVLVVEDDASVRAGIARALRTVGFRVLEADGVDRARELARAAGELHLVLSDMMLGSETGVDVAREVKAVRPEIRVLFMSGYTELALHRHGVSVEDAHFIDKPFTPAALVRRVRELLDLSAPQ